MFEFFLKRVPAQLAGDSTNRLEPCRACGETRAFIISQVDYWDIKQAAIVKCSRCGTAQLDPMLTDDETAKGCLAYYIEESLRSSVNEQSKNALRNYRRGIHFGYALRRKKFYPNEILELGPGSGYFLDGIRFVFPEVKISVMDINDEVLRFNSEHHGFEGFKTTPEHRITPLEKRFDLIIARDILEHVTDIGAVISNVNAYLKNDGLFHFITPNGHEDVWRFYLRYQKNREVSELLINHVNYFDGQGLSDLLTSGGFDELDYFTYKLKTTLRGRGHKFKDALMAPASQKRSADFYVNEKVAQVRSVSLNKETILNKWYLKPGRSAAARFVCWYKHAEWITVDPRINVGHEVYGLFRKR